MSFKLARVARRGLTTGEPLPDAYGTLKDFGIRFYRGGVTLVGGTPGSMKSTFILNLVDTLKVPTLYLSNDNSDATMVSRSLAKRLQRDSHEMRERAFADPEWAEEQLSDMDYIRWSFDPAPTLDDVEEEILAFEELWGEPPHVLVVDVLMKMAYHEDGGGTKDSIVRYLDLLARQYNCAVFLAHHTSENVSGTPCQPMSAFLDKVAKFAIAALTVSRQDESFFLAPVKQRDGFSDASGESYVTFYIDPALATLEEL